MPAPALVRLPPSLRELVALLRSEREALIAFSVGIRTDVAVQDAMDVPAHVDYVGVIDRGFAISDLIWLYYLRERPIAEFVDYLMLQRTPRAAKLARELRRVYSAAAASERQSIIGPRESSGVTPLRP